MILLAIDQGTSGTKCIAFSKDAHPMASATAPLDTRYSSDGRAEQDPEAIYRSVIDAVGKTVTLLEQDAGVKRSEVRCAGIANQRETFLLWDRGGTPLCDAVVWQCKRSTEICEELAAGGSESAIRERSGLIIDPYFSGTKATWLVRNDERVHTAYEAGDALFGTVDSWVLYRLTGGAVHRTDMTNASRTLLFNIHERSWDPTLAQILELDRLVLPEVLPSAHEFGSSDFAGCFAQPIPITAMIGDSHSAFFGERCYEPGSAKATLGTGSSILLNAGDVPPRPYPSTMSTIGFALPDRVDYALEGIIVSAGAVLSWLERELGLFTDAGSLEEIAQSVPDAGGVTLIPGHAGLGAPFWRMDARGSIHGLTFATSRAHIVRAALEAIPYQICAILDAIREESGTACDSIRVDGGISRNRFVTRWIADTTGVPVHTFANPDVTALGAAFLAGIGASIYAGPEEIAKIALQESITEPTGDRAVAEDGYREWRSVVDRNWSSNAR